MNGPLSEFADPFRNAPKGYGRCIDHLIYAEQIVSCLNFFIIAIQGQRKAPRKKPTILHQLEGFDFETN